MIDIIRPDFVHVDESQRPIIDYLFRLCEQLEFLLSGIDEDVAKVSGNSLQITSIASKADEAQQKANRAISVSDVVNSQLFKAALDGRVGDIFGGEDDTMVLYGTVSGSASETFAEEYETVPIVLTDSGQTVTATTTGFTVPTAATFHYIAIGQ